jgi:hypothetical protein
MLATVYHETEFTFRPVEEIGKGAGKSYGIGEDVKYIDGIRGEKGKVYRSIYYGRGYCQLTGAKLYKKGDFQGDPENRSCRMHEVRSARDWFG